MDITYRQFCERLTREGLYVEQSTAVPDARVVTRATMAVAANFYSFIYRGDSAIVPPIEIEKIATVMGVAPERLFQTDEEWAADNESSRQMREKIQR